MTLRRTIAAFLTFAFATLLCAPAFAAFWTIAAKESAAKCCCGHAEESEQPAVHGEKCRCAGCACTVEDHDAPAPFQGVFDSPSISPLAHPEPAPPLELGDGTPLEDQVSVAAARGPPPRPAAPLYILYDTLLI